MPKGKFRRVSLQKELIEAIENYLKTIQTLHTEKARSKIS